MLQRTNKEDRCGSLADAMEGANLFLGVSVKDAVTPQMVQSTQKDPIIIAMANPDPEILPEEAKKAGAAVVGTGRSDFENQVNNVRGFPGIFRGALDVKAMKPASAHALAESVGDRLARDFVIPEAFDERVAPSVAAAVAKAPVESGIARDEKDPEWVRQHTIDLVKGQK
jgi:Malic enzyme